MSSENDRLLELIVKGDTLQALSRIYGGDASDSQRLEINRALYGAGGVEQSERIRAAEQQHRERLAAAQGAEAVTTLYNMGCFALMQDDIVEARLRFSEVLESRPEHLPARHNLAYAHELLAETDEARHEYEAVLAQHPDSVLTHVNLAQLRLQEGDYEGGLAELEQQYSQDPDNMGVLLYLCRGLLLRGAVKDLERVLSLLHEARDAERYVDLRECRAYAQYMKGELDGAEASFRALLDSGPENLFALAGVIKVLGQRSDFKGLRPYAERYQALNPTEPIAAMLSELPEG